MVSLFQICIYYLKPNILIFKWRIWAKDSFYKDKYKSCEGKCVDISDNCRGLCSDRQCKNEDGSCAEILGTDGKVEFGKCKHKCTPKEEPCHGDCYMFLDIKSWTWMQMREVKNLIVSLFDVVYPKFYTIKTFIVCEPTPQQKK